jgi:hypothetical protein
LKNRQPYYWLLLLLLRERMSREKPLRPPLESLAPGQQQQ